MNILDKYILKKFLSTYVFVVLTLVLIICMVDFTEKIDNFRKNKAPTQAIIFDYYFNLIPYWITNFIGPLMVFVSTVFFTSRMAARTEIIAMFSTGIGFIRILVPYFVGAAIIGLLTFVLVGWVVPKANKIRLAFEYKYIDDKFYFNKQHFHVKVAPNLYAYLKNYDNTSNRGEKFTLERIENNELKEKLTSSRIEWDTLRKKWKIYDYKIRTISGLNETLREGASIDTTLNLSPKDFENDKNQYEALTLTQLNSYVDLLRLRGADGVEAYLIEKYVRYTQPFTVLILTAIGVVVSARKSRRGSGWQIAVGFALAFIYLLFFLIAKGIAESGNINMILAVWLPNIIFAAIGYLLYKTMPR
jgi:lipopolysaccharide export system permease protein